MDGSYQGASTSETLISTHLSDNHTTCTLHHKPDTRHPTPYTRHATPYNLHPTPDTIPPTPDRRKVHLGSEARCLLNGLLFLVFGRVARTQCLLVSRLRIIKSAFSIENVSKNTYLVLVFKIEYVLSMSVDPKYIFSINGEASAVPPRIAPASVQGFLAHKKAPTTLGPP